MTRKIIIAILVYLIAIFAWLTYKNIHDIYSNDMNCVAIYADKLNKGIVGWNCIYDLNWARHIDDCWIFLKSDWHLIKWVKLMWYMEWCSIYYNEEYKKKIWFMSKWINENRCVESKIWLSLFPYKNNNGNN